MKNIVAARFIQMFGNIKASPEELLATKPTEAELKTAEKRCYLEVKRAFATIRNHHGMKNPK